MSRVFKLVINKDDLVSIVGSVPEKSDIHGILLNRNQIIPMSNTANKPVKRLHVGDMFVYPMLTVSDNEKLTRFKNGKVISFRNTVSNYVPSVLIIEADEALNF